MFRDLWWGLVGALEPNIEHHLLPEIGEEVEETVHHHGVVYLPSVAALLGAVAMFAIVLFGPIRASGFFLVLTIGLVVFAAYYALEQWRDVLIITNRRVFRISGVISSRSATMPINRILDITVEQPWYARLVGLDFGHFIFETAAQDQGLRDIRYIGEPDRRERMILRIGLKPDGEDPGGGPGLRPFLQ